MIHETTHTNGHSWRMGTFLFGATLGAVVALLTAPRSGREIRGQLRDSAQRMKGTMRRMKDKMGRAPEKIRDTGSKVYEQVRHTVGRTIRPS